MGFHSRIGEWSRKAALREAEEAIEEEILAIEEKMGVTITRSKAAGGLCGWATEYSIVAAVYTRAYGLFGRPQDADKASAYICARRAVCAACLKAKRKLACDRMSAGL